MVRADEARELEEKRLAAIPDLESDESHSEVARKHDVAVTTVIRWRRILDQEGPDGLRSKRQLGKRPPGRPPGPRAWRPKDDPSS